jgi:pentatricopeptide repeat protein
MKNALLVFRLNTRLSPCDFNAWDSLAECYFNMGQLDEAERYYGKSLELKPENENGKQMLEKIAEKR